MKNESGHSKNVIESYHKRDNADYNSLPLPDRKIIDKIDKLLKELSEDGKEYWETYYS